MTDLLFKLIREGYFLMVYPRSFVHPDGIMVIRLQKGEDVVIREFKQTDFIYGNIDPDFLLRENIEAMLQEFKNTKKEN